MEWNDVENLECTSILIFNLFASILLRHEHEVFKIIVFYDFLVASYFQGLWVATWGEAENNESWFLYMLTLVL